METHFGGCSTPVSNSPSTYLSVYLAGNMAVFSEQLPKETVVGEV